MIEQHSWYFTAPWDTTPLRRGDALGFRAAADYFAELLAPGLSNATSDARWITLLSWCLKWSHDAWRHAGGNSLSRREDQSARYAWLRPLELLWVARTLESRESAGQLRGQRSVQRWLQGRSLPNFAMSPDQFRRYRQVGVYGAYRVVFRTMPGLTKGDGWTPDVTALALAKFANDKLPPSARLKEEIFKNGKRWGHWVGDEARYWTMHGWPAWAEKPKGGLLPTPKHSLHSQLPDKERQLLEPVLFGSNPVRRITAEVLAKAKSAKTHADLCIALANSNELLQKLPQEHRASLASLPAFSRFADAAMQAIRSAWESLNQSDEQAPSIEKLAINLHTALEELRAESDAWLRSPDRSHFPFEQVVTRLAETMRDAVTPQSQLRALVRHHQEYGGGRRWLQEKDGKLFPLAKDTGIAASDYRFRLRSLCRLAAQCGVANMSRPLGILASEGAKDDDEDEDTA